MILKKGADMKNRLTIISLCMCLVFCSFSFAFADGDTNIDSKYMSDYSIETQVERDTFNPGEFTVDLALTAVDWLGGGVSDKSTSLKFKTGARMISLSEKLPNLAAFAVAEEIAKASMTGNTFLCSRLPGGTWDGQTGEWKTIIDAPVENIRSALNDFNGYLTVTDMEMRDSAEAPKLPAFYDNMILLKAGTSIQYGNTVITFKKDCEIDELYDEYAQKEYYKSTFAENIYRIQQATETTEASESAIVLNLAKNSYIQFCEKKILANSNISVSIDGADAGDADPLSAVSAALQSAEKTSTKYKDSEGRSMVPHQDYRPYGDVHKDKTYYIHKCDVNGVFDSGFGLINELLGVFAQKDANFIVIADGEASESAGREPDPDAEVSAEIKISSPEAAPCEHLNTYVEGEIKPTVTTAGYSGDVYCADCGGKMYNHRGMAKNQWHTFTPDPVTGLLPADSYQCRTYTMSSRREEKKCFSHYITTQALRTLTPPSPSGTGRSFCAGSGRPPPCARPPTPRPSASASARPRSGSTSWTGFP